MLLSLYLFLSTALAGTLRVVASVPDLEAIAKEVGGEQVKTTSLSLASQDPHWVDARPNLVMELNKADVLLVRGMELEVGWLPTLQTGSRNSAIQNGGEGFVDCSQFVDALGVPQGPIDRSMGDIHPSGNPHYQVDPRAVIAISYGMASKFSELDPDHAAEFHARAADFAGRVDAKRIAWELRLEPLRGKQVIAYHDSWPYLQDWLGFEIPIFVEPKPGVPPSPSHTAKVVSRAKAAQVSILLQESFYPTRTAELVSEKTGATLVVLPSAPAQGETWIDFMESLVGKLEAAL